MATKIQVVKTYIDLEDPEMMEVKEVEELNKMLKSIGSNTVVSIENEEMGYNLVFTVNKEE